MKKQFYYASALLLATVFLTGCPQKQASNINSVDTVSGSDVNLGALVEVLNTLAAGAGTKVNNHTVQEDPSAVPSSRRELGNMRTVTKIYDGKTSAGISVPGFSGLTLGRDEKSLSVYYLETKSVIRNADTAVYGVGYSVHYLFKKVKKGLAVDKLPIVAASVQLEGNKTQVIYSLNTYGIAGGSLVQFFKPVVDRSFDVEGFGVMQAKIDGIHNILSDSALSKSVVFRPQYFKNIKPSNLQ